MNIKNGWYVSSTSTRYIQLTGPQTVARHLKTPPKTPSHALLYYTHSPILPISSTTSIASSLALFSLMALTSSCQSSISQAPLMSALLLPMPSTAITSGLKSQMPVRLSTYMAMNGQPSSALPTGTYHDAVRQNLLA